MEPHLGINLAEIDRLLFVRFLYDFVIFLSSSYKLLNKNRVPYCSYIIDDYDYDDRSK